MTADEIRSKPRASLARRLVFWIAFALALGGVVRIFALLPALLEGGDPAAGSIPAFVLYTVFYSVWPTLVAAVVAGVVLAWRADVPTYRKTCLIAAATLVVFTFLSTMMTWEYVPPPPEVFIDTAFDGAR